MQDCARYVEEMTRLRREIHRRPEEGWTEFETQWKVFRALEALGWTIRVGLDVIRPEAVMGRNAELVEKAMVRAAEHGVPESFLKATGGYTGLTADFDTGREGPVTGFRFDMDCVLVEELHDASHLPAAEGFDSEISGHMHACGHDAHTATGVTLAHWITDHKDELKGRLRLIFQPAEEGTRGAAPMAAAGVVDDLNWFFGAHVGCNCRIGEGCAASYGVECRVTKAGEATNFEATPAACALAVEACAEVFGRDHVTCLETAGGSEDCSILARRAIEHGAEATFLFYGCNHHGHHRADFEIQDTQSLPAALAVLSGICRRTNGL